MANLYDDNNNLAFYNNFSKYLDSSNMLKNFKNLLANNDLQNRKIHDLRNTHATRLFELGE